MPRRSSTDWRPTAWSGREAENGDRRRIRVRLTPEGLEAFEIMALGHEAEVDAILGRLSETDLEALRDILSRAGRPE